MRLGLLALLLATAAGPHPQGLDVDEAGSWVPDRVLVRDRAALARLEAKLGEPVRPDLVVMEPTMPPNIAALYQEAVVAAALPKLLGLLFSGEADPGLRMLIRTVDL